MHNYLKFLINNQKGTAAVMVALIFLILLSIAAFAVDLGYVYTTRSELQNTADAAALAAARKLGNIYQAMTYDQQQAYVCDPTPIVAVADEVAGKNQAGGKNITIKVGEVEIGQWNSSTIPHFTQTYNQPDAVRVTVRRDSEANGPIVTFFANAFGVNNAEVRAQATAALSAMSTAGPGDLPIPIGISRSKFIGGGGWCGDTIKFHPTTDPDACCGWTSFNFIANDITIRRILRGELTNPEVIATLTEFNYINGNLSNNTFNEMDALYQANCVNDPVSGECVWQATIVVYDSDACNPNQSIKVAGFTEVEIFEVLGPPDKSIRARYKCSYVDAAPGRGGALYYGVNGCIPGLVE